MQIPALRVHLRRSAWLTSTLLLLGMSAVKSQPNFADARIGTVRVADNIHMLTGPGGNIGVLTGKDGTFLIDDQYAPLADKVRAALQAISSMPVRFVVNTHWHDDHTGGNENLGEAGALIVAHENVRKRMSVEQFLAVFNARVPPAADGALPVITFTESVTFHWNGEELHVFHVAPAHTDGDSIIHFKKANAVHMGDTYFNGMYPFIDTSTGGSIAGMIAAADRVLSMIDDETKILPGHGPVSNKAELKAYRDMLSAVQGQVSALMSRDLDRDAVIAAKPTRDFDAKWGGGFLKPDVWVGIVFDSIKR